MADSCSTAHRALLYKGRLTAREAQPTEAGTLRLVRESSSGRLPANAVSFAGVSPCGQYCLLKVHHVDEDNIQAWRNGGYALLTHTPHTCKRALRA